jgi:uncharacterized protein (TIGR03067 family)
MQIVALLVAACSSLAAPVENKGRAQAEMKRFQGRWVAIYVEIEGKPIPPEGLEDLKELDILVEGDKVILKEDGMVKESWKVRFSIDPIKAPRTIDLSISVEESRPETLLGIYKFDGDVLKICILPPSKEPERPTKFRTSPGSRALLWHFQRK